MQKEKKIECRLIELLKDSSSLVETTVNFVVHDSSFKGTVTLYSLLSHRAYFFFQTIKSVW